MLGGIVIWTGRSSPQVQAGCDGCWPGKPGRSAPLQRSHFRSKKSRSEGLTSGWIPRCGAGKTSAGWRLGKQDCRVPQREKEQVFWASKSREGMRRKSKFLVGADQWLVIQGRSECQGRSHNSFLGTPGSGTYLRQVSQRNQASRQNVSNQTLGQLPVRHPLNGPLVSKNECDQDDGR